MRPYLVERKYLNRKSTMGGFEDMISYESVPLKKGGDLNARKR